MSLKTKRRFKNLGKITAAAVFALLFFLNIQIILNDDLGSGDLSLFGVEINLFDEVYATAGGTTGHGKWVYYPSHGACRCEPIQLGDTWECTGLWTWSVCSQQ